MGRHHPDLPGDAVLVEHLAAPAHHRQSDSLPITMPTRGHSSPGSDGAVAMSSATTSPRSGPGRGCRRRGVAPIRRHHPAPRCRALARRRSPAVLARRGRSRVEAEHVSSMLSRPAIGSSVRGGRRVALGRHDHHDRSWGPAPSALETGAPASSPRAAASRRSRKPGPARGTTTWVSGSPNLALNSRTRGPSGGQHQRQHRGSRRRGSRLRPGPPAWARTTRSATSASSGRPGFGGRVGAHAPGVRTVVPIVGALVIAGRRQQLEAAAVADREDRHLSALQATPRPPPHRPPRRSAAR